jgi:hypothetical protein
MIMKSAALMDVYSASPERRPDTGQEVQAFELWLRQGLRNGQPDTLREPLPEAWLRLLEGLPTPH